MVGWRITLWAAIVLVALLFLWAVRAILAPFILAFLISGLLEPTIRKLRMRGYSRGAAVSLVFVAFFTIVIAIGVWLTPMVGSQLVQFRTKIEEYSTQLAAESQDQNVFVRWTPVAQLQEKPQGSQIDKLYDSVEPWLVRLNIASSKQEFVEKYITPHEKQITGAAQAFFNSLLGVIAAIASQLLLLIFTPLFVLLILRDMDNFKARSRAWIPPAIRAGTVDLLEDIGHVFISYLRGVSIVLLWYILVASILLTVLGAPYAVVLAVLFSLIYLVPFVGQFLNALILFLVCVFHGTSGNLLFNLGNPVFYSLLLSVIYFVAMLMFDQLMFPRIVGSSVGLHPVASFFCIFAGGALFGAVGMLLAFPLAGSVKVILDRLLRVTTSKEGALALPAVPLRHRA